MDRQSICQSVNSLFPVIMDRQTINKSIQSVGQFVIFPHGPTVNQSVNTVSQSVIRCFPSSWTDSQSVNSMFPVIFIFRDFPSHRPSRHVDANGRVYLPYLHEWKHPTSDLNGLIQIMCLVFGEEPPVYSRVRPLNYRACLSLFIVSRGADSL